MLDRGSTADKFHKETAILYPYRINSMPWSIMKGLECCEKSMNCEFCPISVSNVWKILTMLAQRKLTNNTDGVVMVAYGSLDHLVSNINWTAWSQTEVPAIDKKFITYQNGILKTVTKNLHKAKRLGLLMALHVRKGIPFCFQKQRSWWHKHHSISKCVVIGFFLDMCCYSYARYCCLQNQTTIQARISFMLLMFCPI